MHDHRISPLQQRVVEAMAVRNLLGRRATTATSRTLSRLIDWSRFHYPPSADRLLLATSARGLPSYFCVTAAPPLQR